MDILAFIRRLPDVIAYNAFDDDFSDRLNYSHTVVILTGFALIVTNRQFSDKQIKCWVCLPSIFEHRFLSRLIFSIIKVPAQFVDSYEQYVNRICFITNTYVLDDTHQTLSDDRHEHELKYYQWIPFILLFMAILFYVPRQCWRVLSLRSGVDLKHMIEAGQIYRSANVGRDDKIKLLNYLTNWLNAYCVNTYRLPHRTERSLFFRIGYCLLFPMRIYTGNYLIMSYLLTKCLYFVNSIGQILLLNTFLGGQFWSYGIDVLHQYWTEQGNLLLTSNEYFPKVVRTRLCYLGVNIDIAELTVRSCSLCLGSV
jgi:innexin